MTELTDSHASMLRKMKQSAYQSDDFHPEKALEGLSCLPSLRARSLRSTDIMHPSHPSGVPSLRGVGNESLMRKMRHSTHRSDCSGAVRVTEGL